MRHGRLLVASLSVALLVGVLPPVAGSAAPATAATTSGKRSFLAGAAVASITPPAFGEVDHDPADCGDGGSGPRRFAFEEAYTDSAGTGTYQLGDPFVDCNGNGRWDGILL
jgi:hypothetical protein